VPQRRGQAEVKAANGTPQGFGAAPDGGREVAVPARPLTEIVQTQGVAPGQVALVWSDTQGFEREVIESGEALWPAGVPLFVELWPQGLRAHGGVEAFTAAVARYFKQVVPRADLAAHGAQASARPVGELPQILEALKAGKHTDALLLP
jgi:hypothetical protein